MSHSSGLFRARAISICFDLLAATVLTLLYVSALYLIVRDVRNAVVVSFSVPNQESNQPKTQTR